MADGVAAAHAGPEVVEHVTVEGEALAGGEADLPDPGARVLPAGGACRRAGLRRATRVPARSSGGQLANAPASRFGAGVVVIASDATARRVGAQLSIRAQRVRQCLSVNGARMNLRQLEYLIAIAEDGSFRAAAHRLHVAAPSISQQIRLLELEVGGPLLERLPRGARLTPAGPRVPARGAQRAARRAARAAARVARRSRSSSPRSRSRRCSRSRSGSCRRRSSGCARRTRACRCAARVRPPRSARGRGRRRDRRRRRRSDAAARRGPARPSSSATSRSSR